MNWKGILCRAIPQEWGVLEVSIRQGPLTFWNSLRVFLSLKMMLLLLLLFPCGTCGYLKGIILATYHWVSQKKEGCEAFGKMHTLKGMCLGVLVFRNASWDFYEMLCVSPNTPTQNLEGFY
jgi:hypothetical protein